MKKCQLKELLLTSWNLLRRAHIFLEIMDNSGKMNVVIFDKEAENIEKSNIKINNLINRRIKVFGTVTEYNGSLEVILKDSKSLIIIA